MLPGNIDLTENLDFRNVKKPKEHHPGPALPYKSEIRIDSKDEILTYMNELVTEINLSDYIVRDDYYINEWATTAYSYNTSSYDMVTYNRNRYDYYTIDSQETTLTVSSNSTTNTYVTWKPTRRISITDQEPELKCIFGKYRNPEFNEDKAPALCWGNESRSKEIDDRLEYNTESPWGGLVRDVDNYFRNMDDKQLPWGDGLDSRELDKMTVRGELNNIVEKLPYLANMSYRELRAHFDELYDVDMSSYLTNMGWLGIRDIETSIGTIA